MTMPSRLLRLAASLALCSLLLGARTAAAQAATAQPTPSPGPATAPKLFLWRVQSPTATVYLLGSVHVASEALYPLDERIRQAFAGADTLVLETPMDSDAQVQAAALMQQAGMYAPPDSLATQLDPQTLDKLERTVVSLGLPLQAMLPMRPWLASLTVTLLKLQTLGYRAELGIDRHFHEAAGKRKVAALETLEQQVAIFRDMPKALQIAALRQSLEQAHELPELMRRALELWRKGDTAGFDALLVEPTRKEYPQLYKRLLVDRNKRMAAAIERYLAGKGTVFVVVGSGHLVGRDSIVRMLQARGHAPAQL